MTYRLQQAETRQCKGCGIDFQTDDGRKWFHKRGCGRARVEKQNNAWYLANRPNLPTEPCLTCGAPVVQYRKRRYEGEMRHCGRSCAPSPAKELAKAEWPPRTYGACSGLPKGCSECKTGKQAGLCAVHHNRRFSLRQMLATRLRWLLPRSCSQCGNEYKRFEAARLCLPCKKVNESAGNKWRNIKRKHRMTNGDSTISPTRLYERDQQTCHLCLGKTDHPSVWKTWKDERRWMPDAPTVDHIIPLAKGGSHTWENVALAHWRCNSLKSDSIATVAPNNLASIPTAVPSAEFFKIVSAWGLLKD